MKHMCLFLLLASVSACSGYESADNVRQTIKVRGDQKRAADAEAAEDARLAAIEARYQAEAKKETLSLRKQEADALLKQLDDLVSTESESLAQYPKLVFKSQLALDQITLKDIRARQDEERAMREKEQEESETADKESKGEKPKAMPLALVDHVKGSCMIFTTGQKLFSSNDITTGGLTFSQGGRVLIAEDRSQSAESCQTYFEGILGSRYKEEYFSLHVGFLAFPQDIK